MLLLAVCFGALVAVIVVAVVPSSLSYHFKGMHLTGVVLCKVYVYERRPLLSWSHMNRLVCLFAYVCS